MSVWSFGCERIPEIERHASLGKASDSTRKLIELKKWLWICRGVSSNSNALRSNKNLGDRIEEFVDYFQSKGLSTISFEGTSTLLGAAVLWKSSGYLVSALPNFTDVKEIECSNGIIPWTKAVIKGFDRGLDLAVLKLDAAVAPSLKSYLPWAQRTDPMSLDEVLSVVSTAFPGQVDRLSVQRQPFPVSMHTGLDEDLILFLPTPPEASSGGLLVDSQFRVLGYLSPHRHALWGSAVSTTRVEFSVSSIIENGKVLHPFTGLKLRYQTNEGFIVQQLEVGGPAYRSGLRVDDRVLKWNNRDLKAISDWVEITASDIGRSIPLAYKREGKIIEAQMTIVGSE